MGNLKDYATSTVASPPVPATTDTTLTVQSGHGARFPATPFSATAHPADQLPTLDNAEKITVTNITGDTLTIVRAQGSTTAKSIATGWRISNSLFIQDLDDITDYVDAAIAATKELLYPVGSIYTNATDSTNPATLLGFGTWVAFGAGRVMVGLDSGQTEFDTAEETGGAKTHTLSASEIPAHTHGSKSLTGGWSHHGDEAGGIWRTPSGIVTGTTVSNAYRTPGSVVAGANSLKNMSINATHEHDSFGGGEAHNNLQPYIVVYMWKRTA